MEDPRKKILEQLVDGPPQPKPIRYAIYTRQSVEKLADFSSCQAQFDTCRDFAEAVGVTCPEALSARTLKLSPPRVGTG